MDEREDDFWGADPNADTALMPSPVEEHPPLRTKVPTLKQLNGMRAYLIQERLRASAYRLDRFPFAVHPLY